jgi:hypothetical protein
MDPNNKPLDAGETERAQKIQAGVKLFKNECVETWVHGQADYLLQHGLETPVKSGSNEPAVKDEPKTPIKTEPVSKEPTVKDWPKTPIKTEPVSKEPTVKAWPKTPIKTEPNQGISELPLDPKPSG